jgi:hypothetical protein
MMSLILELKHTIETDKLKDEKKKAAAEELHKE